MVSDITAEQLVGVLALVSSGLLAQLVLVQWVRGPATLVASSALVTAVASLDRKSEVLRLPQVRVVDLSAMGSATACTVLRCLNNGMLSGLQSVVLGSGGRDVAR